MGLNAMRRKWMELIVLTFFGGTVFATSCGDIVVDSVKNGLYSFVSGSLTSTLDTGQLDAFLGDLFAGGGSTTTTTNRNGL